MEFLIEKALHKYFEETIGSDGRSKYLTFVTDDDGQKAGGGNASGYLFGKISYEKDGKTQLSQGLFLKLAEDNKAIQFKNISIPKGYLTVMTMNELFFYTAIRPFFSTFKTMDDILPTFNGSYLSATTTSNVGVTFLDDLRNSEYKECRDAYLDYDHLSLVMRKIGQFHAYSMIAKKKDPNNFYVLAGLSTDAIGATAFIIKSWLQERFKTALKPLRSDQNYTLALKGFDEMMKNYEDLIRQQTEIDKHDKMAVLAHRACRSDNIQFRYKEGKPVDLKILDWQTYTLASLATDVVLILYLEASQQTRDEKWDDLIDEYYVGLSQTFPDNDIPSKEQIKDEVKKRLPSVFLVLGQKYARGTQDLVNDPVTAIIKDMVGRYL